MNGYVPLMLAMLIVVQHFFSSFPTLFYFFIFVCHSLMTRYGESEGEPDKRYGHSLSNGVWAGPVALLALTFMTCAKVAGIAPASMW